MTVIVGRLVGREGACLGAAEPLLQGTKEITFFAASAVVDHVAAVHVAGRVLLGHLGGGESSAPVPGQAVVAGSVRVAVPVAIEAVVVVVAAPVGRGGGVGLAELQGIPKDVI